MAQPHTSSRPSTFFVYVTMAAYWFTPIRTCPVNCTCVSDPFMVVVCSGQDLTTIPTDIPKNTVTLNLAYNKITVLDLRTLYDLESLERVDFSSNEINKIHGSLESVKNLYIIDLSRNNIEAIPWTTFRNVLPQMNVLHLGGNPFNCDCNQRDTDLCYCSEDIFQCTCTCNMEWLQEQVREYPNLGWDVTCQNPVSVRGKDIKEVTFMPQGCETKCHKMLYGAVGGGLGALVLLVTVVVAILCRKKLCRCWNTCHRRRMLGESYSHLTTDPRAEIASSISSSTRMTEVDEEEIRNGEGSRAIGPDPMRNDEAEIHPENGQGETENVDETLEPDRPGLIDQTQPKAYLDVENIINTEHQLVSERLPLEIANMIVTEQQLNKLALKLGKGWENLAIHLGLERAEIDTIKADNVEKNNVQKLGVLLGWKAKQKTNATVWNLVKALETYDDPIDQDKFDFFLASSEVTAQNSEEHTSQGPRSYNNEDIPEDAQTFLRLISSKLKLDLFPQQNEQAEAQRLKKISEWKTNFSSDQIYSVSSEADNLINTRKRAVCKIEFPNGGRGTGFLIGKKQILTCDHVFQGMLQASQTISDSSRFKAIFDLHDDSDHTFYFSNTHPLCRDPDSGLDYAILELDSEPNPDLIPSLGGCIPEVDTTEATRFVVVIGHPSGGPKQLDYAHMAHVDETSAIHVLFGTWPDADTASYQTHSMLFGSSGSPGFDKNGNVILLHTRGINNPFDGPSYILEQGTKLTSIVNHARSRLSGGKFEELFPTFSSNPLFGGGGTIEVEELH